MEKDLEIKYLKAIVRSYRAKAKKVRTLAMAGITREDVMFEDLNDKVGRGKVKDLPVTSDTEDEAECNKVRYSYIDNELFEYDE